MTSKDELEDPAQFAEDVAAVCDTYRRAPELADKGVHVVCTDEKTGMQAVERKYPTKPMRPGLIERQEFEYIRHGTQCLIASFEVASGRIICPTIGDTRKEEDFLGHIQACVETDPEGTWIFVVDQLNTHMSTSLVRFVAARCGIDESDLGVLRNRGVLKSTKTRRKFLRDTSHRIRFVYTPRHCSWLNQIEIWFSILARRVLRRGTFSSTDDLREKVARFIEYFNVVMAKPFRWTYAGRPLRGAS